MKWIVVFACLCWVILMLLWRISILNHHIERSQQVQKLVIAQAILDCQETAAILDWDEEHPLRIFVRAISQDAMKANMQHAITNLISICDQSILESERAKRAAEKVENAKETDSP